LSTISHAKNLNFGATPRALKVFNLLNEMTMERWFVLWNERSTTQFFYIEPLEGNEPAVGFDLGSNQHRLDALTMSTENNATVATSPIELVQRRDSSPGFLIFSPIYSIDNNELTGFISGVFDIDVLIQTSMQNNQSSGINFSLIDESHDPLAPILRGTIENGDFRLLDPTQTTSSQTTSELLLPNRVWTLAIGKSAGAFQRSLWLWTVPILGAIASISLAMSALTIERRRQTSTLLLESEYERAEFSRRIVEQELQNRNQKSLLIDSVSHELRTPLTVITARTDLLARKLPEATEKQKFDLNSISSAAKQLKTMIDSLIEFSTQSDTNSSSSHKIVDIYDILNQVSAHYGGSDIYDRLVTNTPETLQGIRCDETLVKRALIELVDNADQYGTEGEQILLSVTQKESKMIFSLENSGEQIDIKNGLELFQPLSRGSIFGDASQPGIGLGLAFVRSIAEVHGGSVLF